MDSQPKGKATLRAAFAGTGVGSIDVTVNDQPAGKLTRLIVDGVLSSHGSQGIWYERELPFDASLMKHGENKLTLTVPAGADDGWRDLRLSAPGARRKRRAECAVTILTAD